ncbi:MAG: hypothetical protein P8Y95_11815 [Gammaproteobacteria bacterium]|jgi:hypothetical protein
MAIFARIVLAGPVTVVVLLGLARIIDPSRFKSSITRLVQPENVFIPKKPPEPQE